MTKSDKNRPFRRRNPCRYYIPSRLHHPLTSYEDWSWSRGGAAETDEVAAGVWIGGANATERHEQGVPIAVPVDLDVERHMELQLEVAS